MAETRTFKTYNFVTGAVDGTLAYDFGNPELYPQREVYETPRRQKKPRTQSQEWIKEDVQTASETAVHHQVGLGAFTAVGFICAVVLLAMMLLAQIQLLDISSNTAALENQIEALQEERDRLTAEYETVFNLKDVEEYAIDVLGMQEPVDGQISYLTGVSAEDKALIITEESANMFAQGLEDIVASVKAYFD